MKVYELIQELSQFKADTEVEFHVIATFDTDVEAEFDEDVVLEEIEDNENSIYHPNVTINLEY